PLGRRAVGDRALRPRRMREDRLRRRRLYPVPETASARGATVGGHRPPPIAPRLRGLSRVDPCVLGSPLLHLPNDLWTREECGKGGSRPSSKTAEVTP